ncbi:endonuclease domain-containing protein [Streptomyces sp. NPDC059979]|uniref:endonuclease domain-containing protein n=1 Tax=Streptomyces sp. NPDC059979 TaxID=3347021 RepID=UPI0036B083EF
MCFTHLDPATRHSLGEQQAASEAAGRLAQVAERLALLSPAEREAVMREEPVCWAWPSTAPTFEEATPGFTEATRRRVEETEQGRAVSVLEHWHGGRCAICGARHAVLVEDHDHVTGLVRGYLCRSCNTREGLDRAPLSAFARYREQHPASILGLTVRYVDPYTGEEAQPLPARPARPTAEERANNPLHAVYRKRAADRAAAASTTTRSAP